jgi:membrane-bound metal-dependent hydrolase YbcI (DUF457 family)
MVNIHRHFTHSALSVTAYLLGLRLYQRVLQRRWPAAKAAKNEE